MCGGVCGVWVCVCVICLKHAIINLVSEFKVTYCFCHFGFEVIKDDFDLGQVDRNSILSAIGTISQLDIDF